MCNTRTLLITQFQSYLNNTLFISDYAFFRNVMYSPPKVTDKDRKDFSFPKIELHLHLDGAIRFSTLLETSQ